MHKKYDVFSKSAWENTELFQQLYGEISAEIIIGEEVQSSEKHDD